MNRLANDALVVQSLLHTPAADIYDHEVFRHLLWVERRRAAQAGRSLLLLLVSLSPSKAGVTIPPHVASALFAGFQTCVREVDLVGWYEQSRVLGAVLVQRAEPTDDVLADISERVTRILSASVSPRIAERIRVRVVRVNTGIDAHV